VVKDIVFVAVLISVTRCNVSAVDERWSCQASWLVKV